MSFSSTVANVDFVQVCSIIYNGLCLGRKVPLQHKLRVRVDAKTFLTRIEVGTWLAYRLETTRKPEQILCGGFSLNFEFHSS